MSFTSRSIAAFAAWFASPACVVETLIGCVLVAAAEAAWPQIDPHNFRFLYAMTFYSSVTQPILAYAAWKGSQYLEQMLRNQSDTMRALIALAREMQREQGEILKEIEELADEED